MLFVDGFAKSIDVRIARQRFFLSTRLCEKRNIGFLQLGNEYKKAFTEPDVIIPDKMVKIDFAR